MLCVFGYSQQNGNEALKSLSQNIKSHKNIAIDFKYHLEGEAALNGKSQQGQGWLQGEAYKVVVEDQQTICDGSTIWNYLIEDEEVMVSSASDGEDNTPIKLFTSLDKDYQAKIVNCDAKGITTLELFSDKKDIRKIVLKVDLSKKSIKEARIYTDDTPVIIEITKMSYDQELSKDFFLFDEAKHPGVEVIDMR